MALTPIPPNPIGECRVWRDWLNENRNATNLSITGVTIVDENGFTGTVNPSTPTTVSSLTLGVSVTGMLKGSGGAIKAAVAAIDYVAPSPYASLNGLTMTTNKLLGRSTASTGHAEEITLGTGLSLSAGTLTATGSGGTVTSVSGTAPVVSSGGTTPAISMAAATASVDGYLTHTNWTTFNNKQPAGAYLTGNQTITLGGVLSGSGTTSITAAFASTPWTGNGVNGTASGLYGTPAISVGALSATGQLTLSGAVSNPILVTGQTTGLQYWEMKNAGADLMFGINNSAGTAITGGTAYSTFLTTNNSTALEFGTNGVSRMALDASGVLSIGRYFNSVGSTLSFTVAASSVFNVQATEVYPASNGTIALGDTSLRWSQVWCTAGAFNSSDARLKTSVTPLASNELQAAKEISAAIGIYQWLDAVAKKGAGARLHVGLTVQQAIAIMQTNGLDWTQYGFIGYDKWEANDERPAGDCYSFRYDELNQFVAAGMNARIAAIESSLIH